MSSFVSVRDCLRKATSRAKSDVANKLVSMFLHELSRRITLELKLNVGDPAYAEEIERHFGSCCAYCRRALEKDRLAVEHLEGMNRIRVGLHIPGNVVLSCKDCNREKRRDDQLRQLVLGETGWSSFLAHTGDVCPAGCKTCAHWAGVWPEASTRRLELASSSRRIAEFQTHFGRFATRVQSLRTVIHRDVEALYRDCQSFATERITGMTDDVMSRGH